MKSISLQMTISKKSTHYYSLLLLILVSAGLWSCSTLQRDPRSGYGFFEQDLPQANDFYEQKKAYEIDETLQDMGLGQGFYLTDGERSALATRIELKNLEKKIPTRGEKKQYYQYKGLMRSDGERIAFLSLPSTEIRAQWAKNRGYLVNEESFSEEQKLLIEKNDITLGMNQKAVMESWGDPDVIEVAGDPIYGNERWQYSKYVSATEGFQKQIKVVYFESGHVVGWESN